ncbi:hypothetical protein HNY73_005949 [Argiope bruennichi]|uniref:DUF5641 domain-containing protein n=1 Tax=Argiope bruennichi TaxID=94029 RepID=A0A8T0FKM1_ARGBR|nr:hypothetical protein HNY73_005949 [Argiope bruennichi]
MTFLRQEVQGEEMVVLSRTGFAANQVTRKKEYVPSPLNEISGDLATTAALTLCVIARGQGREKRIRILLDSASQYSHVSERLIVHLGLIPHRYENVIHSLFGGTQTKPKQHGVYSIELSALNGDDSCCFEVFSEEKMCNSVPKITDQRILNNLRELNMEFSDSFSEDLEIDVLVGSNVLGRILMKKCCELDSGLTVVETKLGNTIIGMQNEVCHIDRNVMTTLAMYVRNIKLTDLWDLENLGISNPTLVKSKQNSYEEALNDFQQKLTILPNGRYELQLPWKHDPANLPDNKGLTWVRHEKVIKRAESNGFLREYQNVFEDWENLGIIESVPEEEKRIRYRRKLIHDFRSRFRKEFLGKLRQKRPGKSGHDFKVGEVVMIEEPSKKRVYWPLGKVISLLAGRDGKVRILKLKFKNSELIRPIQKVYPLEIPFINNEIVKIDGVPTSSVKENELTSNAVIRNKITKSGRLVKIPERLGLFNEILHAFDRGKIASRSPPGYILDSLEFPPLSSCDQPSFLSPWPQHAGSALPCSQLPTSVDTVPSYVSSYPSAFQKVQKCQSVAPQFILDSAEFPALFPQDNLNFYLLGQNMLLLGL